jgi:alginate O-acetyltransferase complex protein AlgJ
MHPQTPVRTSARLGLVALLSLLSATAAVALFAPAAGGFSVVAEVREPASRPGWPTSLRDVRQWPRRFEAYVGDAFPGRSALIGAGNALLWRLGLLRSSRVIEGADSWLFLGDFQQQTIAKSRGLVPLAPEQAARWAEQFESTRVWAAEHGAELRLVIIPDKQTVYPQHLPGWAQPGTAERPTRTDQIVEALRRHGAVGFLDLRPVLRAAASRQQVYWRTDSHWNPAGALIAAEQVLPWLRPDQPHAVRALLERCSVAEGAERMTGDLVRILGVEAFPAEASATLRVAEPRAEASAPWRTVWGLEQPFRTSVEGGIPGKLLVLGDSFLDTWWPVLAELSRETVYFPHQSLQVSRGLLEREKPAVVLLIIVERLLPAAGPVLVP